MAELYTVNYTINVKSQQAINALNSFQTATSKLTQAGNKLKTFERQINKTVAQFNKLSKKTPLLDFSTSKANQKLDVIIRKLEKINRLARQNRTITVNTAASTGKTSTGTGGVFVGGRQKSSGATSRAVRPARGGNYSYKVLGPAMIDTGGVGAIDMLKGMGIAYGITGLGTLLSSAIKDAVEYNNLMQTTRNILETHDSDKGSFKTRFKNMEDLARYIGISTKFTAPEVADMTKFLAMAGLDINAINHAMQPVANVALIGDTDLGKTADLVTNIMTGYNIKPENIGRATDIMTMTFTSANTTLTEIAEAYKYSASLLSAADVPFEEATAALGILGNAGIKGSQGGTSLRTILANIVNPRSKKRADAWNEIGVSRFNQDGSMRSLVDIFRDLHDLDLDPKMYYRLFDRTAAQGAVSLAAHVDTWNDIISRNFLSEGVAKKLADKKKNTMQGLWYQLTSTFTEKSMQVFEENSSPIRQFLIETREWINGDDFKKTLGLLSSMLLNLLKLFKWYTENIMTIFNKFGVVIEWWLKLQLVLSTILIPLRIFKSLFNFAGLFASTAMQIGRLTSAFGSLFGVLNKGIGMRHQMAGMWNQMMPEKIHERYSVMLRDGRLLNKNGVSSFHAQRYYAMQQRRNFMVGAGSMVGAGLGGYLGSHIGESGSATNILATIGGAAGGAFLFSALPKMVTAMGALVGISGAAAGGILGIVAALGIALVYWTKTAKKLNECTKAHDDYLESIRTVDGISYAEGATQADKYLSIVYNKQLSVNQAIGEHIKLVKEQMGLYNQPKDETVTFKEKYGKQLDDLKASVKFLRGIKTVQDYTKRVFYLPDGSIDMNLTATGKYVKDEVLGGKVYHYFLQGEEFEWEDQVEVARQLYLMGRDTSEGTNLRKKIDEFNARLLTASTIGDYEAVIKDIELYVQQLQYKEGTKKWTSTDLENSTDYEQNYWWVKGHKAAVSEQFLGSSANASRLNDWKQILALYNAGKPIPDSLLYNFLLKSGVPLFDSKIYKDFGSDEFMRNFGWWDGQWHEGVYDTAEWDEKTKSWKKTSVKSDEARDYFLKYRSLISQIVNQLHPDLRSIFNHILEHPIWSYGDASKKDKITQALGIDWIWRNNQWEPLTDEGRFVPMSDADMLKVMAVNPKDGSGTGTDTDTPSQSQYSQDYKSSTATPKQVIVRIENLMNVESIDMSNPENVAVISNLKSQLAQALIDVVHDFDATYQ